jgi:hypothetical protein
MSFVQFCFSISFDLGNMIVITHLGFRLPASDSMTATHGAEPDRKDERGAGVLEAASRTESANGASNSRQSYNVSTPYMQLKEACALLRRGYHKACAHNCIIVRNSLLMLSTCRVAYVSSV